MNFTLRAFEKNKVIQRIQTHSLRRFLRHLRTINWQKPQSHIYLKVSYGKQEDCHGKMITFYNDGVYENKNDLQIAFNAFIEDSHKNAAETDS